ncbi:hypothetical protein MMPV_009109 [Pyropia vietnamensis]
MTVERFLSELSYAERSFLMSWDIEQHITPTGLAQAAVWFCQNTCSAEMLQFLFPGVPVLKPRQGMLGAAMVDDLAHLPAGCLEARSATSECIPPDAWVWATAATGDTPSETGEWRVRTSVIDFSGFAASLSAVLTGVYSHQLGGTVNGITYTSRLDQFGHFLVVPASSVLLPFKLSRRSEMHALEEAFANVALGSTPVLNDTTVFRVSGVQQLEAGWTNHGCAAKGRDRGGVAMQCEDVSVTTHKAASCIGETPQTASETASSSVAPTGSSGRDVADSWDVADEDGDFEQPSPDAAAAFSQMFTQCHAELV